MITVLVVGVLMGTLIKMIANLLIAETPILKIASWRTLNYRTLIPIFQWPYIKDRNSRREVVESMTLQIIAVTILLLLSFKYEMDFNRWEYTFCTFMLMIIGYVDFKTTYVYRSTIWITAAGSLLFIVYEILQTKEWPIDSLLGALIGFIIIGLIVWLTGGMGEGDIEIGAVCGLMVGIKGILLTLFIAFVLGGVVGVIILALRLKGKKDEIAFGPYLVLGCLITMLYGQKIIDIYLHTIGLNY